jgi:hypothetical protein
MNTTEIAAVCHEANRMLCLSLGDTSQPTWFNAPDWQRTSAQNGVEFHLAHPDATAAASHEQWLDEKERTGWRYGPVKDPEAKTHPCFVPFAELPVEQQRKDYLFRAIVHALAPLHVKAEQAA